MSATVFSSSQMELVAGIANSGFAHEGTGFMGVPGGKRRFVLLLGTPPFQVCFV